MFVHAQPGQVTFGSELKALAVDPSFDRTLDSGALTSYLRYLYVPAPRTIFRNTLKLEPGHILTIRDPGSPLPASVPYWSAAEAARRGLADPLVVTDDEAVAQLDDLLVEMVGMRMQADVPLGALLSGGVDSSTVVSIMQSLSDRPVKTFTIGFDQSVHDEAASARAVATHLGTEHAELHLTGKDALDVVPLLPEMFDEPLADPSQIPTYLVCQLARREVTVALTGDGGDEIFAGYNRYTQGERLIGRTQRIPFSIRLLSALGIGTLSEENWDRVHGVLSPLLPHSTRVRLPGAKLRKIGGLMTEASEAGMYQSLMSASHAPLDLLIAGAEDNGDSETTFEAGTGALLDRMMLADQIRYLPDDLLAKVDRASMAVSLEARVPLLDHRLVEFAWRLPRHLKIRDGRGKWILRQVLYKRVPPVLVDREKVGFSVPIAEWLRGPLRVWADDLLAPDRLKRQGIFKPEAVRRTWERLLRGGTSDSLEVWAIVMFQAWYDRWER
jgi:asparagine synthase (glutamine-hydrolysing)